MYVERDLDGLTDCLCISKKELFQIARRLVSLNKIEIRDGFKINLLLGKHYLEVEEQHKYEDSNGGLSKKAKEGI